VFLTAPGWTALSTVTSVQLYILVVLRKFDDASEDGRINVGRNM
jgi:hypothetical protein